MNDDERTRPRWRARAARLLAFGVLAAFALAVLLVGLLHLPPVRRVVTEAAVRKASSALGGNLRTGEVRWNLFTGTLDARDLLVRGEGDRAGTEISVARLHARLSLAALVRGRIVLEEIVVEQPRALLALDANGRLLHPLQPPRTGEGTTAERPDVDVRSFRLSAGRLELVDRGPAGRHVALTDVALDGSLRLRDLTSKGTLTFP